MVLTQGPVRASALPGFPANATMLSDWLKEPKLLLANDEQPRVAAADSPVRGRDQVRIFRCLGHVRIAGDNTVDLGMKRHITKNQVYF